MEDLLEVYARPYNCNLPVVCMDESSIDKLVKSRIPMAKKKAPPNHKIGEARKS
jgi:hypothetical protein